MFPCAVPVPTLFDILHILKYCNPVIAGIVSSTVSKIMVLDESANLVIVIEVDEFLVIL